MIKLGNCIKAYTCFLRFGNLCKYSFIYGRNFGYTDTAIRTICIL